MRKYFFLVLAFLLISTICFAAYLGEYEIDDYCTFSVNVHNPLTSAAADADTAPTYQIYEDETALYIASGGMSLLGADNTTGFYSERIQLTTASGFEEGKSYTVYISATYDSVTATKADVFKIKSRTSLIY